ncbi:MAG: hypothetical protein ACK583_17990 [Cyanobacteriota bacterium]
MLAEGRAHRRSGVGFAGLEGQLDHSYDFFGHRLGKRLVRGGHWTICG